MNSLTVRFSLATLMSIVAGAALMFAALRSASVFWASATFTLSVAVLLFSLLAVVFRRDAARAFWVGFLLFGWAYLSMVFGPWFSTNVKDHLLTSKVLGYSYNKIASLPTSSGGRGTVLGDVDNDGWVDMYVANMQSPNYWFRNVGNGRFEDVTRRARMGAGMIDSDGDGNVEFFVTNPWSAAGPSWDNLQRVGHSLFSLLAGLVGGLLALFLWRSRGGRPADA